MYIYIFHETTPSSGLGAPNCRGFTVTLRKTTLGRTPGRVINPTQKPLSHNTQHSQEIYIHAAGGIRTRNPSKLAAPYPCLRKLGLRRRSAVLAC